MSLKLILHHNNGSITEFQQNKDIKETMLLFDWMDEYANEV